MGALAGYQKNPLQHRNEARPDRMDAAELQKSRRLNGYSPRVLKMKGKTNGMGGRDDRAHGL